LHFLVNSIKKSHLKILVRIYISDIKTLKIRSGYIRPIPYGKSNFKRWSGVHDVKIKIKNNDIKLVYSKYINELYK
jgi:hypothetical protein